MFGYIKAIVWAVVVVLLLLLAVPYLPSFFKTSGGAFGLRPSLFTHPAPSHAPISGRTPELAPP